MFEIDKVQFGVFLLGLRKEKGYTQKQLAEKLFVSDKAVSKWEAGAESSGYYTSRSSGGYTGCDSCGTAADTAYQ